MLRSLHRAAPVAKRAAFGMRTFATAEPTLKDRLTELLPQKAEEIKQLKKEHGKTVCIKFTNVWHCTALEAGDAVLECAVR